MIMHLMKGRTQRSALNPCPPIRLIVRADPRVRPLRSYGAGTPIGAAGATGAAGTAGAVTGAVDIIGAAACG